MTVTVFADDSKKAEVGDFIALMKPGVMTLVVFTGFVGMMMAPGFKHPLLVFMNILALAMGSGGAAAFNMWYDRDIDGRMDRTRERPIPGGRVAPHDTVTFAVMLTVSSLVLMAFASSLAASALLAFSIFFYAYLYTTVLKRWTPQNIVIGGAAGAFPPLIGWMTVSMHDLWLPLWMFAIIFLWTPSHFWALALIRSDDYAQVGVPMLPVTHGALSTKRHIYVYALLLAVTSFLPCFFQHLGWFYGVIALVLGGGYMALTHQLWVRGDNPAAGRLFGYSIFYLFVLFMAMLIDTGFRSF